MSPEAITNIIFGVVMTLLGTLEIVLVERIVSRRCHVPDIEGQMLLSYLETSGEQVRGSSMTPVELPADAVASSGVHMVAQVQK